MVLSKLRASFEKQGLQPMKLMGEKFDPYKHEVALREDCDSPEGQIVRVISQGYNFRGLPLKHAIVSVSSGKKDDKANGNSGTEEKKE
jgi:molecular chaperone GrpE